MKLQILVPQYQETDEVIKPLLDSLMIQQSVDFNDFGVIIVNDGSDVLLSGDLLSQYPYKILYFQAPHRGVSATRNTCLDYATADYVMFCDADDLFMNACGLYLIFREIKKGFDTLSSKFVEDARTVDNEIVYINHDNDCTFVHGKIHRRQFLIDNEIRWNPELTIHEDSFFNAQCSIFAKNALYLNDAFYLWKWRKDSICRTDKKYLLKTYSKLLDSMDCLIARLETKGYPEKAIYYTVYTLMNTYYTLWKPEWKTEENLEYRNTVELRAYKFYIKYKTLWGKCPMNDAMKISEPLRAKAIKEGMALEDLSIANWLKKLEDNYKNTLLNKENK